MEIWRDSIRDDNIFSDESLSNGKLGTARALFRATVFFSSFGGRLVTMRCSVCCIVMWVCSCSSLTYLLNVVANLKTLVISNLQGADLSDALT